MGAVREGLEQVLHVLPKQGVKRDRLLVGLELCLGGQLPVLEEIGDLEEGCLLGELLDQIAPVMEDALLATDVGDRRDALGGVGKATIEGRQAQVPSQPADIRRDLALDTLDHIEPRLFVAKSDYGVGHSSPSLIVQSSASRDAAITCCASLCGTSA